ncbi:MAG TPA: glutathionylspermidine synthase family protein [Acidobacteriaceae bacterium]|nr:glutathionylspermidine synthase family protein [Acidobacteriaceae bacterium]
MRRIASQPRDEWQSKVEAAGLVYHSPRQSQDRQYWDESCYYEFTASEVDMLEATANTLQEMCLAAAQRVIDEKLYEELAIPPEAIPLIEWAWEAEPPAVYGRFDVMYDGKSDPKLLEYNADTPTSLLEASVVQWSWLEELFPKADQFNSLHERLIAKWKDIAPFLSKPVYFTCMEDAEDWITTNYLRETAEQAGLTTRLIQIKDIGWNEGMQSFVNLDDERIFSTFKLYPWEAMLRDDFAPQLLQTYREVKWIEPIWKLLLSNKGILPVLWEMYPGHKNLLPAYRDSPRELSEYVRKPLFSREGQNIAVVTKERSWETPGRYGDVPVMYQQYARPAMFDERCPVLGLWMIDQECGGMGIRESATPVTDNLSSFVPHLFVS